MTIPKEIIRYGATYVLKEEEKKPFEIPKPEYEQRFWVILLHGDVIEDTWVSDAFDYKVLNQGNIFLTEEAATKEKKRRAAQTKLTALAGGWVPDWDDIDQRKHFLQYSHRIKTWAVDYAVTIQDIGQVYFLTEEAAEAALEEMGDQMEDLK